MFDFKGRKILITGATSTIGSAICQQLATHHADLILMGSNSEKLTALQASLKHSDSHTAIVYDFNDCDALPSVLTQGIDTPVAGFVHCAGIRPLVPLRFFSKSAFESLIAINVTSAFLILQHLRKRPMRSEYGMSAVMISSVAGRVGQSAISGYSASKGALEAAVRSWAIELARENIRVNSIAPGYVEGRMLEEHKKVMPEEKYNEIVCSHPLGLGTPEDVANATTFLLSPWSRWITGTTLTVDGGYTAQ
ncbi:SDR family NAD(P)-dependent oxidoreductase [Desulfovibrio caledoniensis]